MPGYMMHLAESQIILNKLKKAKDTIRLSENDFRLGVLLPDAVMDKEMTHFRSTDQKAQITKYPDMAYLLETYPRGTLSSCDLGIVAHLHMDARFVTDFWPKYFTFLNRNGSYTNITSDIDHVWIYSSEKRVPFEQFFSDSWFYGEYDILNPYICSSVQLYIPEVDVLPEDIQIRECTQIDLSFLQKILTTLSEEIAFSTASIWKPSIQPKIFLKEDIFAFLEECADIFIEKILLQK